MDSGMNSAWPEQLAIWYCQSVTGQSFSNFSSVSQPLPWLHAYQFSCSVVSDSLQPLGPRHARLPCPSPTPRAYSNSCPSSWWCLPTISSSAILFSSCLQSFPASKSLPISHFFTSGSQRTGASASASVLAINIYAGFPLGLTGLNFLLSKL